MDHLFNLAWQALNSNPSEAHSISNRWREREHGSVYARVCHEERRRNRRCCIDRWKAISCCIWQDYFWSQDIKYLNLCVLLWHRMAWHVQTFIFWISLFILWKFGGCSCLAGWLAVWLSGWWLYGCVQKCQWRIKAEISAEILNRIQFWWSTSIDLDDDLLYNMLPHVVV